MADQRYILSLDQGTTSSRAILFDRQGRVVCQHSQEFPQLYPRPGWVEHDPEDIWRSQVETAKRVLAETNQGAAALEAIGITNQRETTLVWDRATGRPIHNAIVWQDRRTAGLCDKLKADGWRKPVQEKTGLVVDAYFSGTKIKWLLDNVEGAHAKAQRGELLFGNVDTFLIWRLTGGQVHVTDYSNASRTMLFDIRRLKWDADLLHALGIPEQMLPEPRPSSEVYGHTSTDLFDHAIPIAGDAGDQQAATFGQACFRPGLAKNTYGTGCFMLLNTGDTPVRSDQNLLTTVGWGLDGKVSYCLEGSVFSTGSAIQYLRDSLKIIGSAAESEMLAASVASTGGVYVVPAFTGLGAPYWDQYARAAILGLTRGSGRAEVVRATLEAVAYQSRDLLDAMVADCGFALRELRVDGGMVVNNFLMQFQSDILGVPVKRPVVTETTALGAAYLAGLASGYWSGLAEIEENWALDQEFRPRMDEDTRGRLYGGWRKAVRRTLAWEDPDG